MLRNKFFRIFFGELFLVFLLISALAMIKMIPNQTAKENNLQSETLFRKIYEKDNYITTFKASENRLKRLDVLFKNPNLESRDEIEIILLDNKKELFRYSYNGYNFGDTSHARIDFSPIINSKNNEYSLVVREIKKVDGKLELGIKNDEINFIQYYGQNISVRGSILDSINILNNIFKTQAIVLVLPMLLWGVFLW